MNETLIVAPAIRVGDALLRVTAPNPGPMTGAGTNTYLVQDGSRFAVIDPGPDDERHREAILAATGGVENIAMILVTHMHPDHSPLARPLAKLSGASIYGWHPVDDEFQDTSCLPDHIVKHDQVLLLGGQRLRCIYTPGHVDNHVCYLLENEQILMTGDHIMQGSTVVIIPPHGNMKKYIESLQILTNYNLCKLAPGHGEMIMTPMEEISGIIRHRLAREQKVMTVLEQLVRAPLDELLEVVYDDVPRYMHTFAELSLLAHLIKLEEECRVVRSEDKWLLAQ